MLFADVKRDFLYHLAYERGLSEHTLRSYRMWLVYFGRPVANGIRRLAVSGCRRA